MEVVYTFNISAWYGPAVWATTTLIHDLAFFFFTKTAKSCIRLVVPPAALAHTEQYLTTFSMIELVVDGTVVSKDNKEEKTREAADIRMYHFSGIFQQGYDMLW